MWIIAHHAPLSMGFPRQQYLGGVPFPSPGDISNPGIDPKSPAWQQIFYHWGMLAMGLPCWLRNKESACHTGDNVRDAGLIPESGRFPGGRHGNPLQYSCLENPMDREAWQATIHRVRKSQTQLKRLRTHTCWLMATTPSSVQLSTNYWSSHCVRNTVNSQDYSEQKEKSLPSRDCVSSLEYSVIKIPFLPPTTPLKLLWQSHHCLSYQIQWIGFGPQQHFL